MATQNGTQGRAYGGDCELVHVADGQRAAMGRNVAVVLDSFMRAAAEANGMRSAEDAYTQDLCPGCYMIVAFNMLVCLAEENDQNLQELACTMARAFAKLAEGGKTAARMEEIEVILDPEETQRYLVAMRD